MTNMKNIIAGAIIGALVLAGGILVGHSLFKSHPAPESPPVGSVTSNDSTSEYQCNNGVCRYFYRVTMRTATNTPCAIAFPKNASTTLEKFSYNFTSASSTAVVVTVATSTNAYATTTAITTDYIVASASKTGEFLPTASQPGIQNGPGFVVLGLQGGTHIGGMPVYSPVGSCEAVFTAI